MNHIVTGAIISGSIGAGVAGAWIIQKIIDGNKSKQPTQGIDYDGRIETGDQSLDQAIHSKYKVVTRKKTVMFRQPTNDDVSSTAYPRLKIPRDSHPENRLIEELRFLDNPLCEIEKVHNLIIDNGLTEIDEIISRKDLPAEAFVFTNQFILYKVEYGPTCMIQSAKRWLRAGPRYNLYFEPERVRPLILSVGSIVPGINVVIREIVRSLTNNYHVKKVYGAKFGYKGVIEENIIEVTEALVNSIHTRGGSFLGVCRGGFDLNKILEVITRRGFNQIIIIGGDGAMRSADVLQTEIQKRKLEISVVVVPKSVQGDIPISEEQMGFQTTIEETSKAVETGFVESQSHEYGIGLIRCFGRNSGYVASHVAEATGCVDIVLVPEFQWDLYGEKGVLEYIRRQLIQKKHLIIIVSEGAVNSLRDVQLEEQGEDESGNKIFVNIGEFLKDKIVQYCKEKQQQVTIKFVDPLYITRACRANPHDTKICTQMAQNAVHGCMAGFTGFAVVIVHGKTAFVPLKEMISGQYETKLVPNNRHWQRVLSSTLQPSFIHNEDEHAKGVFE